MVFLGSGQQRQGQGKIRAEAQRQRKSRACWSVVLGGQTCRLIPAISLNLFCLDSLECAGTLPTLQGGRGAKKEVQGRSARAMRRRSASLPKSGVHEIDFGEHDDDESTRTRASSGCHLLAATNPKLTQPGPLFPEVSHCG